MSYKGLSPDSRSFVLSGLSTTLNDSGVSGSDHSNGYEALSRPGDLQSTSRYGLPVPCLDFAVRYQRMDLGSRPSFCR